MKVTINGFIHYQDQSSYGMSSYHFFKADDMSEHGYVKVMPCEFQADIPGDFNPEAAQISALESMKDRLHKEFSLRISEINEKISKLQCLEFTLAGEA